MLKAGQEEILSSGSIVFPSGVSLRTHIYFIINAIMMTGLCRDEQGGSSQIGILLLLALTVLLSVVIIAVLGFIPFSFDLFPEDEPCIFEIEKVTHTNKDGVYKLASRVTLWYNDTPSQPAVDAESRLRKLFGCERVEPDREKVYDKDDLWAQVYKNHKLLNVKIPTLKPNHFIPTHHYGIQTINGQETWENGGRITIDFNDGTFWPGDTVRVEIFSKSEGRLISADRYDIPEVENS